MQINFGRAIKVNTNLPPSQNIFDPVNPLVKAVFETFDGQSSDYFSPKQEKEIRTFLRSEIDDYSPSEGIFYKVIDNTTYLFTGKDIEKARTIEDTTRQALFRAKSHTLRQEIKNQRNHSLLNLVEDGLSFNDKGEHKKYIELFLASKDNKIDKIVVYKWPYENTKKPDLGASVLDLKA